ncbi:MAG: hypothetical protein IT347_07600 [Candidatus Eisenbacteria bacterium]|nr:hypothetical protein [Candidatus Eisenbacteria bacterium]
MAVAALALLVPALAGPASAQVAPRTIVVRGRTLAPDGKPLAGARVMARGSVSVSALTDDEGRYALSLPLGMPAALKRLPFRIEVRAEAQGRRLGLSGGGTSLVVDAAWQAGGGRVRVHSNRAAAANAVVTALELESVPVAWIEADFGGAATGGTEGSFSHDAILPGEAPPPPAETPPMPRAVAPPAGTADPNPAPAAIARDSVALADAPPPLAPRDSVAVATAPPPAAPRDSAAVATVPPPAPARDSVVPAPAPPAATRDSVVLAPAPPAATRDSVALATAPPPAAPRAVPRNSARSAPPPPRVVASSREVAAPPPRPSAVRAMDPYVRRDSVPRADTCRCSVRGTVEIGWDRPLEEHTPVTLVLDAPGARPVEVSLFMGAPREFRFGPLPCGEWRLGYKAGGRLRYADARGDSTRVVPCTGATETRIVLLPLRR